MSAADRKTVAALLEKVAAELAAAEALTEESSRAYAVRSGDPSSRWPHQVGALGFITNGAAARIRSIIRNDLVPRRGGTK